MLTILEGTYRNGILILDRRLGQEQEGKKFKVILAEETDTEGMKARFFQFVAEQELTLAQDYRFDREEL